MVAADRTFKEVISDAINDRDAINGWIKRAGSVDAAIAELSKTFGLDPADTPESIETRDCSPHPLIPVAERADLIEIFRPVRPRTDAIAALERAHASGRERIDAIWAIFSTERVRASQADGHQAVGDWHPIGFRGWSAEQKRSAPCSPASARSAASAPPPSSPSPRVHPALRRGKGSLRALDFGDLIQDARSAHARGRRLGAVQARWRARPRAARRGAGHQPGAVGDRAQLTAEFTRRRRAAPMPAPCSRSATRSSRSSRSRARRRSEYDAVRRAFRSSATARCWVAFRAVRSFVPLGRAVFWVAVDRGVPRRHFRSVTADSDGKPVHMALPDPRRGWSIWPLIEPDDAGDRRLGRAVRRRPRDQPAGKLARKIAAPVNTSRPARRSASIAGRSGDVLVLVRQRGALFEAIIRALKTERVAVAGADRLVLSEHIALVDLLALADALLLAEDDLALAIVLKSPLFGFDDELCCSLSPGPPRQPARALAAGRGTRTFAAADGALARWPTRRAARRRSASSPGCSAPARPRSGFLRAAGARSGRCARRIPRTGARL